MIIGCLDEILKCALLSRGPSTVLRWRGESWTGSSIWAQAEQVAARLGDRRGQSVAVRLGHSPALLAAVLGVLKSGALCLPLELKMPEERVCLFLETAGVQLIVDSAWLSEESGELPGTVALRESDDPALLFFTSGSTGLPKGVLQTHRQVCLGQWGPLACLGLGAEDRVLMRAPAGTSGLACDLGWAWLSGATPVVADEQEKNDPMALASLVRREAVTMMCLNASLLAALLECSDFLQADGLRLVVCAGEPLAPDLWSKMDTALPGRLAVIYGATEAPSTTYRPPGCEGSPNNVGWPVPGKFVSILQGGEVWVGGGIAAGYWNRPDLTAERFGEMPDGKRMYRTGDLGRLLPDGSLELLGRSDQQIKVRGHRVEPVEIETVLRAHPRIREAVVGLREGRLVAWISPRGQSPSLPDLRRFCAARLPAFMLPEAMVEVESLPRNAGGKLERTALPAPPVFQAAPGDRVLTVVREVLGCAEVSATESFFDAGGNSLSAMVLLQRLEQSFGVRLPVTTMLEGPSAQALVEALAAPPQDQCVYCFHEQGLGAPLLCVHPVGGEILAFRELAECLRGIRPVYGFRAVESAVLSSVEARARTYLQSLPAGSEKQPLCLLGYSAGGAIALEMALQWQAQGGEVAWLGVVDLPAPGSDYWNIHRLWKPSNLASLLAEVPQRLREFGWKRVGRMIGVAGRFLMALLGIRWDLPPIGAVPNLPPARQRLLDQIQESLLHYRPCRHYRGEVTLFRPRVQPLLSSHAPDLGWGQICDSVTLRWVAGDHRDFLQDAGLRQALRSQGVSDRPSSSP